MNFARGRANAVPPVVVDSFMAAGIFAMGMSNRAETAEILADVFLRAPDTLNVLLIAAQTLPLALRRRFPLTILGVVLAAFAIDRALDYPGTIASIGMVLAFHALGTELPPRRSLIIGSILVTFVTVWAIAGALTLDSIKWADVISTGLLVAAPLLLGREVHRRQRRMEVFEERATSAEREREKRAEEAVAEERARIARELHDVVAHQMAVMTLQAEGARRFAGDSNPRVAASLDTIRQTGHDALAEMRRMVGLLRDASGPANSALSPQPGLGDLDQMVAQMRDAGLVVRLERTGSERKLSNGLELNAFRIVQESLTNALKHGGPEVSATVHVGYGEDRLELVVSDDGQGGDAGNGSGQGLVGMRERVAMLRGELTAAPLPGGGFRVHASLPMGS